MTLQLLADRFAGLRGKSSEITAEERARLKQQMRVGISGHASVITVFTSNYALGEEGRQALIPLDMFYHVLPLEVRRRRREKERDKHGELCCYYHNYYEYYYHDYCNDYYYYYY